MKQIFFLRLKPACRRFRLLLMGILLSVFAAFPSVQPVAAAQSEAAASQEAFSDFHKEELNLYAGAAVLTDADSGRILYGKAANTPMANASTTKILTCILALENGNPEDVVTVSEYACKMPAVKMGFAAGDRFYLKDLLYALMLESYNDAAVAIAEHIAGSVEGFADKMNQKAAELGCENSHFITPNGLDAEDEGGIHSTTAYDLSRIMAYCIRNEEFLEITRADSRQVSDLDGSRTYSLQNHNALLSMMDGALSGKTGFTADAGYCYVGAYRSGEHTYTFALLACGWPNHKDYKWSDSRQLIVYADATYSDRVISEGEKNFRIPLAQAVRREEGICFPPSIGACTTGEAVTGFLSDSDQIEIRYDLPETLTAPLKAGEVIGAEEIYLNGQLYGSRQVVLTETAELFDYSWCLKFVLQETAL